MFMIAYNLAVDEASDALDACNFVQYNRIIGKFKGNRKQAMRLKLVARGHRARILVAESLLNASNH